MATVNQSTYDALKGIVDQKALWHNAKSLGQNPDVYKDNAKQYYNQLINSNQNSLVDQLKASNYEQAKKLLDSYTVEPTVSKNTGSVKNKSLTEQANSLLPLFQSYTQPSAQQAAFQQQQQQNLQNLYNSYMAGQAAANQKNNELYNSLKGQAAQSREDYKDLYNRLFNTNYLDSDVSKTILEGYGIKGNAAAANESASGAADNGGNIDSYSAANAKRQQLAYKNAGQQAALSAWDTQLARALETLQSMGADVSGYYDRMQGNVDSNADYLKSLLSSYTTGTGDLGNQLNESQANNAEYLAGLLSSLIEADTDRYKTDAEVGMQESVNKYNMDIAKMQNDLTRYQSELEDKLTRYQADKSAENKLELQKLSNEIEKYISDNELTATRETNSINAQLQREANALSRELAQLEAEGIVSEGNEYDWMHEGAVESTEISASAKRILDNIYSKSFGRNAVGTTWEQQKNEFYDGVNDAIDKGWITRNDAKNYIEQNASVATLE